MTGKDEHDHDIVDALYGGLSDDELIELKARVAGDEALARSVQSFEGVLREVATHLPDEAPSPKLHGAVMKKAAQALPASARETQPSLWQRLTDSWLMRPGMMAAASMVLVVSFAGVLYNKGGLHFTDEESGDAESQVAESQVADSVLEGGSLNEARGDDGRFEEAELQAGGQEFDESVLGQEDRAFGSNTSAGVESKSKSKSRRERQQAAEKREYASPPPSSDQVSQSPRPERAKKSKSAARAPARRGASRAREPNRSAELSDSPSQSRSGASPVGASISVDDADFANSFEDVATDAPADKSERAKGSAGKERQMPQEEEADSENAAPAAKRDSADSRLSDWLDEFNRSSRAGRCTPAAVAANDIREQSPSFYQDRVVGSSGAKRCQTEIASERKRRLEKSESSR